MSLLEPQGEKDEPGKEKEVNTFPCREWEWEELGGGRETEENYGKKRGKREEERRERERVGGEKPVTAEKDPARLSALKEGTVDSSKCIEQVLQNQRRVTFRKRRPVESAPRASGPRCPFSAARRILNRRRRREEENVRQRAAHSGRRFPGAGFLKKCV